jgi:DMSO reductase anchor subunit
LFTLGAVLSFCRSFKPVPAVYRTVLPDSSCCRSHAFYGQGSLLALVLLVAGLGASFFHLGHPERAWRTATMWRTSWLSREVIVLPAFMGVVFLYGLAHWLDWHPVLMTLPGGLAGGSQRHSRRGGHAAGLRPVRVHGDDLRLPEVPRRMALAADRDQLHPARRSFRVSPWRLPLPHATAPELVGFLAGWAAIITLLGFVGRVPSLYRNARLKPKSTLQTAIGIKHPKIVQKTQGFMGGSFNTREFFHGQPVAVLRGVKWFFLLAVFPLPLMLLLSGMQGGIGLLAAAFRGAVCGLLAERWYFFAQANHPQNLYYQSIA